jgi:surface polysaccharide O-acyltransferase-like enzyme
VGSIGVECWQLEGTMGESLKTRFVYLDNVRSFVIVLVIAMHAAVTYSSMGDWYYVEGSLENLSIFEMVFFGFSQSFLQAWFMGILFFISGFLAVKALARRGTFNFIKERLFRLGLPLLLYVFIVSPIIYFILLGNVPENSFIVNYSLFITKFWWIDATGPLWFVETLLLFCIGYVIFKKMFSYFIKIQDITSKNIVFTIVVTGIIAFLVRLIFPIGSSFLNLQFSYFTSYIVLFIAGVLIGENNLLDKITDEKNIKWIKIALIAGTPLWFIIVLFGGALEGETYFNGGFYWQSFAFSQWESLTAIGFSIGLLAFFRKKVNWNNKLASLIRNNSFGIYFLHAPILITITLLLTDLALNPILKFAIVTMITFLACLMLSFLIRKIKPIGNLLK